MKEYNIIERIFRWIDRVLLKYEKFITVFSISFCGLLLLFGVLNREIFKFPLRWTEEATRTLLVIMIFTAQPVICRERAHLKMAVLSEMLEGRKSGWFVDMLGDLALAATYVLLFILWLKYTLKTAAFPQTSPALGYPMWILYALCTLSFALAMLRTLMVTWDDYFSKKSLFPKTGEDISVN